MDSEFKDIEHIFENKINMLASIQHDIWAHWQNYVHSVAIVNEDGSLTIPRELVEHWQEQINTKYENLSINEQESDINQVEKFKSIVLKMLLEANKLGG